MRVLDAGCGYGRNLVYLLRHGCGVLALDADPDGVAHVRRMAESFNPGQPAENFQVGAIEQMPFLDHCADVVLCSSVLHFSRDQAHFQAMLAELWRVLRPGGLLFTRIGSRIGMDFDPLGNGLYRTGDGSAWFLVDEAMLMIQTAQWNATLVDPLKTTIVQNHRCMTTWVLRKPST
jgi:SAM-dependent methyltransferase